ncbi:MAG: xylosidase [Clostridia bacterium]
MKLEYSNLIGLEIDMNMTRRDPSPVVKIDGTYYVYYSKCEAINGYAATIWAASSKDGETWQEENMVIGKGEAGDFDAGGVFTPTTLITDGYIYLTYTSVRDDFVNTSTEAEGLTRVGLVKSKNPLGPFERIHKEPILVTGEAPAFDSHRVDDTCIIKHDNKYFMYYKGRQIGLGQKETKMGLAIAEKPEGPYVKYENNPVQMGGHEVCVYPSRGGFISLVTGWSDIANTYRYSKDGIHFEKLGDIQIDQSMGPYREDGYENNKDFDLKWGVFHDYVEKRPYLRRFDVVEM